MQQSRLQKRSRSGKIIKQLIPENLRDDIETALDSAWEDIAVGAES